MKRTISLIMVIAIVSKLLGFFRDIALTYYYGATYISDSYLIALSIPNTLTAIIGIGIATCFIPIYEKAKKESGIDRADKFTSNILNIILVIATAIALIVLLRTEIFVRVFASGFSGETLQLAIRLTRLSIVGIYFSVIIFVLNSYLQVNGNFIVPAMIGIPMNLVAIASYYLASKKNVDILAYGIVASLAVQVVFLIRATIKKGYKYSFIIDLNDKYIKSIMMLLLPIIIGVSVNEVNVIIDKTIASRLVEGGISSLNYANKLTDVVIGLFVVPITTVIYPSISKMAISHDFSEIRKTISKSLTLISLLVIPSTVGIIVLSSPIIEFLFMRGEFDQRAALMTSNALLYYSIGMIAFAYRDVFSKVYYSLNDTKTPMINSVIGVILNIILNITLSYYLGISGLALATSISAYITSYLLIFGLKKRIVDFEFRKVWINVSKIFISSLIMGTVSYFVFQFTNMRLELGLALLISVLISMFVYLIVIITIKIDEIKYIMEIINKKIGRKK
ncbi:murein biosynthesis integral membrane protein MurJ [Youngiibacter multivorans]|uniref:Probable lipid II flippase MurJ n=1 Tax=Youngiibacter multivorans TaxID=937251 RepID=A0ABS4G3U6_9CLOT|nr:murein biosynthesis integral membrane protein MurJ [Youngiibacter multivorans]MBP1919010.1 putative peptidoglycan lipid II flippase [Youngiibacter multivorans]